MLPYLTDVSLPSSLKSIGSQSFQGCESLTKLRISSGVVSLGIYLFEGSENRQELYVPSTVTEARQALNNAPRNLVVYCETQTVADLLEYDGTIIVDLTKFE